ncbi:VOC family protein [Azospirillum rugosum]|uniref:Catechol 2,3-dioxygenase-like lactoylglutathione lyase family enzyme n=2 Tax=Azospirillum rugosum TaxID=416170 RepID=A0ABS4SWL2_9PROT|nr:VOC family protein [Azospirillum rugosum]MBP2296644.1 catechol 2,3-dioxygenase-like lactoylglutathione lyase family enzyme [Azospirillum rugosum]MDQ0530297.1 catechol 2,3-dioxygenase-like lactoylglutathione lyase family enzyme [Azospirillum rugosum]
MEPHPMEQRISLITLGVADLARSRRFYEAGLGWTPSPASQEAITFYQLGGMALALYGREALAEDAHLAEAGPTSGFGGITLAHNLRSREEVDALMARAAHAGARILKPAQEVFWGGYSGYFADPDGHPWEVCWNPHFPLAADGSLRLPG